MASLRLSRYTTHLPILQKLTTLLATAEIPTTFITLDALQSSLSLKQSLLSLLENLLLLPIHHCHIPQQIDTTDGLNISEGLILDRLIKYDANDEEPERKYSVYGPYDPVIHFQTRELTQGLPSHIVIHKTFIYAFSSTNNLDLFRADPDKYIGAGVGLCGKRNVSLRSTDSTNVTRWAKQIASYYKLCIVNMNEFVEEILLDEETDGERKGLYEMILGDLNEGGEIGAVVYVDLVKFYIAEQELDNVFFCGLGLL